MKRILLSAFLFLMLVGTTFAQYDVIDSVNVALQIARAALPIADSTLYATQSDLAAVTVAGDTSGYTVAEIDSLLGMIQNGDSLIGTAATLDSLITAYWAGTLGGGATVLNDLTDTDVGAAVNGDIIIYNDATGKWEAVANNASLTAGYAAFNVTEIAYIDTFFILWINNDITIDSVKAESDDSVSVQVNIVGASTTSLFNGAQLVNGTTTITAFQDDAWELDNKAFLYFTYVGDNLGYLRLKFYWRYL